MEDLFKNRMVIKSGGKDLIDWLKARNGKSVDVVQGVDHAEGEDSGAIATCLVDQETKEYLVVDIEFLSRRDCGGGLNVAEQKQAFVKAMNTRT